MKKLLLLAVMSFMLASCAGVQTPAAGLLYTSAKSPVAVTGTTGSSKVGVGTLSSILGLIATGDASIETAAKQAGITKIHHVDQFATNILGIYATYTIYVYGE